MRDALMHPPRQYSLADLPLFTDVLPRLPQEVRDSALRMAELFRGVELKDCIIEASKEGPR